MVYCVSDLFLMLPSGAVAGLVAITPAAGFVSQTGAFIIGVVSGAAVSRGVLIKDILHFDDALDAFGVHAIGGVIGSFMVGLFAKEEVGGVNGAFYGHPRQLGLQVYAIVVTVGWAVVGTWGVMTFVDNLVGLRVRKSKEGNLDQSQHGSTMYSRLAAVPERKKEAEEERKKTWIRKIRERNASKDAALDDVDHDLDATRAAKLEKINRQVEMSSHHESKSMNGNSGPNPQGGEEHNLEDVSLEESNGMISKQDHDEAI